MDGFTHLLKSVSESDLGTDRISVWSNVAKNDEGVVGADGVGYFLKGIIVSHTDGTFACWGV
jgi:hypothetical protein